MTLFDSTFHTMISDMVSGGWDSHRISTHTAYLKDDVLTIEFEVLAYLIKILRLQLKTEFWKLKPNEKIVNSIRDTKSTMRLTSTKHLQLQRMVFSPLLFPNTKTERLKRLMLKLSSYVKSGWVLFHPFLYL